MATRPIGLKLGLYTGHNPINQMAGFRHIHQPPAPPTKMGLYLYGHLPIGLKLTLYTGPNPINPMAGFSHIHQPPAPPTLKMGSYLYGHLADWAETWFIYRP